MVVGGFERGWVGWETGGEGRGTKLAKILRWEFKRGDKLRIIYSFRSTISRWKTRLVCSASSRGTARAGRSSARAGGTTAAIPPSLPTSRTSTMARYSLPHPAPRHPQTPIPALQAQGQAALATQTLRFRISHPQTRQVRLMRVCPFWTKPAKEHKRSEWRVVYTQIGRPPAKFKRRVLEPKAAERNPGNNRNERLPGH